MASTAIIFIYVLGLYAVNIAASVTILLQQEQQIPQLYILQWLQQIGTLSRISAVSVFLCIVLDGVGAWFKAEHRSFNQGAAALMSRDRGACMCHALVLELLSLECWLFLLLRSVFSVLVQALYSLEFSVVLKLEKAHCWTSFPDLNQPHVQSKFSGLGKACCMVIDLFQEGTSLKTVKCFRVYSLLHQQCVCYSRKLLIQTRALSQVSRLLIVIGGTPHSTLTCFATLDLLFCKRETGQTIYIKSQRFE